MSDNLINHNSSISIGGRDIYNLRFADDIDLISGSIGELQQLTNSLSKHASDYGMEISSEKSKTMVKVESLHANIRMNREILEGVDKFKYLGVTITKDGTSEAEYKSMYKTLVLSIYFYGCKAWTITEKMKKNESLRK